MSNSSSVTDSLLRTPYSVSSSASEQFLRFHLEPDITALLPIQHLSEVLTIPIGQIVPIFNLPAWVMGVYNWRGEVLWMVDLNHLIGLTPWYQQMSKGRQHTVLNESHSLAQPIKPVSIAHTAIVLHVRSRNATSTHLKSQMLGVVVNRVEDIEWCNPDLIQSPSSSTVIPELVPFLRGCWLKSNGDLLVVFDSEAIFAAMPKSDVSAGF